MPHRLLRVSRTSPAAFLLGGLALTLLIWMLGAAFALQSRSTEVARAGDMARGVSETLAFNAAATIHNIDGALSSVADAFGSDWWRFEFERFRATGLLRAAIAGAPAVTSAAVVNKDGRVLHRDASPEPAEEALDGWTTFQWHQEAAAQVPRLSLLSRGGPGGLTSTLVATRRISAPDGSFLGIVMMELERRYIERELHAGRLWDGAIVGLYGHDGTLLAATGRTDLMPPLPDRVAERLLAVAASAEAAGGGADPHRTEGQAVTDSDRIVAFSRVDGMPLAVGLAVPQAETLARWREDTLRSMVLLIVLTLVLMVTALALRATVRDLSANQRMVAENERRFRSIFNNAGAGIALVDEAGRIAEINEGFAAILRRRRTDLIGMTLLDITHPDDEPLSRERGESVRAGEASTMQYEKRYVLPDGGIVWVEVTLSPQIEVASRDLAPGRPRGSVVIARDITARRAAREVIQEKTRALERSNVELEEFAYVASHDLQEPLRTVASYLQLLQRRHGDRLDGDAREYIGFAVAGAHRMSLLIQDLLQYSRVGRMGKPFQPIALERPLKQATQALSTAIAETGATVTLPKGAPTILGDEPEVTRLFQNLIGNAIKYRRPDVPPEVRVTVEPGEDEWIVSVADNGIGIEPRYYERVFKIFQRLHGRDKYDGTGVGLSICKKIAERHGGRIWVDSRPGEGATFCVALPTLERARETGPAEAAVEAA